MAGVKVILIACLLALGTADVIGFELCCEDDLGCYNNFDASFFNFRYRPGPIILPQCFLGSKIPLVLNTISNPEKSQILDPNQPSSLTSSNFDGSRPTKILIHGFLDKFNRPAWKLVKDEFLAEGDYNVVRVDWSKGNFFPYGQATANVRLVGAYVAKFVDHVIRKHGAKAKDIHIIGHSLGAHCAGNAGAVLQTKYNTTIARITGLDPAGPLFSNMPAIVTLNPSDAAVVDTIVTNGDRLFSLPVAYGSDEVYGHLNFYPNGGVHQPGCTSLTGTLFPTAQTTSFIANGSIPFVLAPGIVLPEQIQTDKTPFDMLYDSAMQEAAIRGDLPPSPESLAPGVPEPPRALFTDSFEVLGCSHNRAVLLFAATIAKSTCQMRAYQCDNYAKFRGSDDCSSCNGRGHSCSPMGYHADLSLAKKGEQKKFYTVTTPRAPFCSDMKIELTMVRNADAVAYGEFYVTVFGSKADSCKMVLTKGSFDLQPGANYTFYPELSKDVGKMERIVVGWERHKSLFSQIINPFDLHAKKEIRLEEAVTITDSEGLVSVFTLQKMKIVAGEEISARLTSTYEQ